MPSLVALATSGVDTVLVVRDLPFFWKAYLSIKQPLTAHGPIHPRCQAGTVRDLPA
jgi:hypothetical protein